MPFDAPAKNAMLDNRGAAIDAMGIHTADPGTGADNEVDGNGYTRLNPSFDSADDGEMFLAANLEFDGPASEDANWFTLWSGATRQGKGIITGDTAFNAEGRFDMTTGTVLRIVDPT